MSRNVIAISIIFLGSVVGGAGAQIAASGGSNAISQIAQYFSYSGSLAISGDNSFPRNAVTNENISVSGNATAPNQGINYWYLNDSANAGANVLAGHYLRQQVTSGASGNRIGTYTYLSLDGMPSAADPSYQNYVADTAQGYSNSPAKTGLVGGNNFSGYAGSYWAMNPNAWLGSGATNWLGLYGIEVDANVFSGANVAEKIGVMIVESVLDTAQGTLEDAAIEIGNGGGGSGWRHGIEFGGTRKNWPFTSSSTLIGSTQQTQPSLGGAPTAMYGVDFSNMTFSSGGAPFLAPLITPSSSSATCKAGSIEWDTNFIYICTASNVFKRAALSTF